jgi:hypothetical protein
LVYTTVYSEKIKNWYKISDFSPYRPKDGGQGQNWIHIIFLSWNPTKMMQLWSCLRLQPLYFGLYDKNIKIFISIFDFFTIGSGEPEPQLHHFSMQELHQHDAAPVLTPAPTILLLSK